MHDFKDNLVFDIVEKSAGAYICLKKLVNNTVNFYATYINQAFENIFHISKDELDGIPFTTLLDEMSFNKENLIDLIILVEKNGRTYKDTVYSYKYGNYFNLSVYKLSEGNICCMFINMSDYQEKNELLIEIKEQLKKREEMYEYISNASNDGFSYINHKTGYKLISQKWCELFSISKNELDNLDLFLEQISAEDRNNFILNYKKYLEQKVGSFDIEYRLKDEKTWLHHTGILTYDKNGICEEVNFFKDISDVKRKQAELEYMAYFDSNTDTYNRNYFVNFLTNALKKAKANSKLVQVLYIDINNLKKINDITSFSIGDELIYKFAQLLLAFESPNIKIGRFCNDEFAIAIYDASSDYGAEQLYKKIIMELEKPISLNNGLEFNISITVGIAKYPNIDTSADELIKCADIAMCKAKNNPKSGKMVFEEKMLQEFMHNINLELRLKNAVEHGDFILCFQPQYDSDKIRIRGVEALIRWKDKEEGYISPDKFIPMAENNGCIIELGIWVINEALKTYSIWKHNYNFKGIISINISAIQLEDKNFADILLSHVEKYNIDTSNVEIEITESIFISDFVMTGKVICDLREKGFRISLDDFGTGYSSLSYLKDIPIDTLKIDKTFINSMVFEPSTSIITSSVIEMVKKLGLETIAEGVETEEQFKYLRNINCDNIQGFYLGKPMYADDFLKLIKEESKKYE